MLNLIVYVYFTSPTFVQVQGQPIRIPLPLPTSQLATIVPEGELISLNCSPPIPSLRFHPGPVFPATNFGTSIQPAVLFSLAQLGVYSIILFVGIIYGLRQLNINF
jgi:hypothetical protein